MLLYFSLFKNQAMTLKEKKERKYTDSQNKTQHYVEKQLEVCVIALLKRGHYRSINAEALKHSTMTFFQHRR